MLPSDVERGLTDAQTARQEARCGPNALAAAERRSAFASFADQFKSLIVVLLLTAAADTRALGDHIEVVAVLVGIVLNAPVGFLTEWRAEQALIALQGQAVPTAQVLRDGRERQVPASGPVPGDVVVLSEGMRVPADGRIVESVRLQVGEAALTGESVLVTKSAAPVPEPAAPLGDRRETAYLGTAVTAGRGRLLVTATGMRTEAGRIGRLMAEAGGRDTPLERKLAQLGNALIAVVWVLCAVIVLAGWLRGPDLLRGLDLLYLLVVGLSLAVAAVPEGLPVVATMTLAIGMQRLARLRPLVRRLPAVGTLGFDYRHLHRERTTPWHATR